MPSPANKSFLFLISVCFLLLASAGRSQDKKKDFIAVVDALTAIENTYLIKFSYIDEELEGIKTSVPDLSATLELVLADLSRETHLSFHKISDKYYTISSLRKDQVYCGTILDLSNDQPLIGATIEVTDKGIARVTDAEGSFTLTNLDDNSVVLIRSLGYEPLEINAERLKTVPCLTLRLSPNVEALEEVVVQKYLTSGMIKQRDGSIVIRTRDFGILPGLIEPDILQTVQALPGIESFNETVSNINIRGGTNDQNLILWDGIKMYQSGHFFGLISAFNPYLTEKVTVTKNGSSATLNDGVSGTIDMQSFNTISDSIFAGAGFNLISGDIFAHIPIGKKFGIQVSARRSITDQIKSPTYDQFYDRAFQDSKITSVQNEQSESSIERREDFYFYDTSFKGFYDISKDHKFRLNFINMNNQLDYEESISMKDTLETKKSTLDQRNYSFGGSLESRWNSNLSTVISGYYTNYSLDATNSALLTNQELKLNNEVLEKGGKLVTDLRLGQQMNLVSGYQFYEIGVINMEKVNDPSFLSKSKRVVLNHSAFAEIKYVSLSNATYLRAGMRLNYLTPFGSFIPEPRINLNQKLAKNLALEIQGEMKSQVTNQVINLERDFLGIEKRRWVLANNRDLPVTKSKQASLGINYNKHNFYMGVEGFYKQVTGITTSGQGFQNQDQFVRTSGNYDVYGGELIINRKTSRYSTWLSYTYMNNNYTFEELTPSTFPNNLDITHSLSFAGTYTFWNKLKLAMGLIWHTGKPFTMPEEGNEVTMTNTGNHINYGQPNAVTLPEYMRADASSTYKFRLSDDVKATVGLAVLNIFNKRNTLDVYYRLADAQSTEVQRVENVSLGITPNASFRVYF